MRELLLLFLCLGFMMPGSLAATEANILPNPGEHLLEVTSTWDGTSQPSMLFVPTALQSEWKLPLLVALHGKGVDHAAWFRYTPVTAKAEERGYMVVCPYGRGDFWYRGPGEQDVLDVIDYLIATERVDPDRVYLAGHSMGGWGTWWIGLRNADRFASIAPLAGFPPMDLLPNALHLDPYIIHDRDDDIVPVDLSRRPATRLSELGITHRYVETTGYGHRSKLIGDSLDDLFDWFSARRRASDPKRTLLAVRTPAKATNHTLRIVEIESPLEIAKVEMESLDTGVLSVRTSNVAAFAFEVVYPNILTEFLENPDDRPIVPIRIDGQLIEVRVPPPEIVQPGSLETTVTTYMVRARDVHLFRKTEGAWLITLEERIPSSAISRKSVSPELEVGLANAPPEEVARILGAAIARGAGVDAMIVRTDAFAWLGAPLTPDRLADSYISPAETLGIHVLKGAEIIRILDADSALVLAGVNREDLVGNATYTVASPVGFLMRQDAFQSPLATSGPIYKYLLQGFNITTWDQPTRPF